MEAMTISDQVNALETGDVFKSFKADKGLVCLNTDQVKFQKLKNCTNFYKNLIFRPMDNVKIIKFDTYARKTPISTTPNQVLLISQHPLLGQPLNNKHNDYVIIIMFVVRRT
jgi:hypothetical protein